MQFLGLEIRKAVPPNTSAVLDNRGWWPLIREPYTGAWQRNDEWTVDTVLAFHAVYACVTLIAQDIGKLRPKLVEQDANGIWTETKSPAFSPVLKKPNRYQTHIQFKEWWILSKLLRGNTYVLKERDSRGVVVALYILDPSRVKVLVAPDGSVYYELAQDNLAGLRENDVVPASEIIHDRMSCLFHPLVGVSPIFASGNAANLGLRIGNSSSNFFEHGANPSGILTAPTTIPQATADRLKAHWETNYTGDNSGRVAVLGDGLQFTPMRMTSTDAQLIEQLKWSAETVASAFHVPPFKVGIGAMPTYPNAAEALNQIYYSDCLQAHVESFELCMDEGLGIGFGESKDGKILGVELDLDGLIRMDTGAQVTALTTAIGGSLLTVDEARAKVDKKPLKGGNTVYMQQQNFSLAALAERDADKPFSKPTEPTPSPTTSQPGSSPRSEPDETEDDGAATERRALLDLYEKAIAA